MKITLTGATGFIGKALLQTLAEQGHVVRTAGRRAAPGVAFSRWESTSSVFPPAAVEATDVIVHLAGEPLARRWNEDVKRRILESRVDGTNAVVAAIGKASVQPRLLICASAIGYYGDRGEETLRESSAPGGGYLSEVCVSWESAARQAEAMGVRVVMLRTGIVLGKDGGALAQMLLPFRLGLGGRIGSGNQWMSWIHIDDIVGLVLHAIRTEEFRGPVNATAPNPVRNRDFTRELAAVLFRPALFPVPVFALRLLFGEMHQVILSSQRVMPAAALASGYRFRYTELAAALRAVTA
ncbi:MAG: TIGR01777 family protein [Acidobacteria bacterium]|nr:TIGR01777 family protein [Acidobacteriota bacterium]